ncbi:MAG TPA: chromosomal replication initiator protein DnaA [Oligoflexia bacterium]|nr:chromosomal replication initiator protein DnaA [Oligoflexia bacterium]HMP26899.1 chromosomal replication initiator protein DnaA [Oligoflexia bacterium]
MNNLSDKTENQFIFEEFIRFIKNSTESELFRAYFDPIKLESFDRDLRKVALKVPSKFISSQLQNRFKDMIKASFEQIAGIANINIEFLTDPSLRPSASEPQIGGNSHYIGDKKSGGRNGATSASYLFRGLEPARSPSKINGSRSSLIRATNSGLPRRSFHSPNSQNSEEIQSSFEKELFEKPNLLPNYTFDSFVVGNSNQFSHAAAYSVAQNLGAGYNPLFIYGGAGLGKTHLLHAIGNHLIKTAPHKNVIYLSSESFTNLLINALRSGKMELFKERLRGVDLLLIDDIQFMRGKERTQEEFFHTFNALYGAKKQIVLSSDATPNSIGGLEERLKTRFSWGLIADIQPPDYETRVAILRKLVAAHSIQIDDQIINYIANNLSSNVRELEGAIIRLRALSSLIKPDNLSFEKAVSILRPLTQQKMVSLSVNDIKRAVCCHFNIKVSELCSKLRSRNISFPRQIAMYLCRKHTVLSYPEIGAQFGGREHSSVIHSCSVVGERLLVDDKLIMTVKEIEKTFFGDS